MTGYRDTFEYLVAKAVYDAIINNAQPEFIQNLKYKYVGIVPALEEQNYPALLVAAELTSITTRGINADHGYIMDVVITYITKSKINDINSVYVDLEKATYNIVNAIETGIKDSFGLAPDHNIIFYPTINITNSFEIRDYPRMNETYIVYRTYTLRCEVV